MVPYYKLDSVLQKRITEVLALRTSDCDWSTQYIQIVWR